MSPLGRSRHRWYSGFAGVIGLAALPILSASLTAQTAALSSYSVRPSTGIDTTPASPQVKTDQALVSLNVKDSTIAYVVRTLVHDAHLKLLYDVDDPAFNKRVSVRVNKDPILNALTQVLKGTGLTAQFASDGETIVVRNPLEHASSDHPRADGGSLKGVVIDSATGQAISGATVSIQGTELTTTTSERGAFTLTGIPTGDRLLEIRAFGYKPLRQPVQVADNGAQTFHLTMTQVATMLSGVVTTATGIQSKLSVGSDITTINVDSVMKTAPIHSVTDLLENRVPGLTVVHTSGTPGDPSRLLLRGAASIYGSNNPIIVVDGIRIYDPQNLGSVQSQVEAGQNNDLSGLPRPSPLDQIDPNTIATIEVLKGPSASALYGSDAANGVIVITTKKGEPGHTHWSVNASQGVSYIPGDFPTLTYEFGHNYASSGELQCVAGQAIKSKTSYPCIIDSVRTFQALNDQRFSPLTTGPQSSLSATVSGGAQALTYSFTASGQNTHGMTKLPSFAIDQYTNAVGSTPPAWMRHPDDYVGWNGSGQIQATLSPQATITVSDMLGNSTQHRTSLGLSAVGSLIDVYVDTTRIANTPAYTDFFTQITQGTITSTTNATLNWRVRPWLPLTVTGGYNRTQENDKQYIPSGLPASILPAGSDTTGMYDLATLQATVATLNANTTIPVALGRGPGLQLALGTNFVSQSSAGQDIHTTQVPVGVSDPTSFPQTIATSVSQQTQSSATYGWFFEPQLQLHSRLFITPGIRLDGGTASGSGAGLSAFPKTNVSYIAVDHTEDMGGSAWSQALTLLRLRGAFGIAGVQPTPGQALRLFDAPTVVTLDGGNSNSTESLLASLGNTQLHPERSREVEAGFDAQFFRNRATVTATYYNKLRIDAIESVPVGWSVAGNENTYFNIGTIRNTGVELTTDVQLLNRDAVTWNLNGSFSTNDNRVVSSKLGAGAIVSCIGSALYYYQQTLPCALSGYPLGAQFTRSFLGYADLNHDGMIEYNEIIQGDSIEYVGSPDPRYVVTLSTNAAFWHGRVSISAQGDYQDGMTQKSLFNQKLIESAANTPGATLYEQIEGINALNVGSANGFVQVVNALRIDAVSVNVNLPSAVATLFRAHQTTLSLQGSNLGLWSNYRGPDPNVSGFLSGLGSTDGGGLPQARTWMLSMRITQ